MPQAKPILYKGTFFPSQRALARHLGVSQSSIHLRLRRGTLEENNGPNPHPYPLFLGPLANCQPVSALGHHWPSQQAAATALGVTATAVCKALNKGRFEELVRRKLGPKDGMAPSPRE